MTCLRYVLGKEESGRENVWQFWLVNEGASRLGEGERTSYMTLVHTTHAIGKNIAKTFQIRCSCVQSKSFSTGSACLIGSGNEQDRPCASSLKPSLRGGVCSIQCRYIGHYCTGLPLCIYKILESLSSALTASMRYLGIIQTRSDNRTWAFVSGTARLRASGGIAMRVERI